MTAEKWEEIAEANRLKGESVSDEEERKVCRMISFACGKMSEALRIDLNGVTAPLPLDSGEEFIGESINFVDSIQELCKDEK